MLQGGGADQRVGAVVAEGCKELAGSLLEGNLRLIAREGLD